MSISEETLNKFKRLQPDIQNAGAITSGGVTRIRTPSSDAEHIAVLEARVGVLTDYLDLVIKTLREIDSE